MNADSRNQRNISTLRYTFLYVCMYVYMYVCMYACVYVCMYTITLFAGLNSLQADLVTVFSAMKKDNGSYGVDFAIE